MEQHLEFILAKAKEIFKREDLSPVTRFNEDLNAKSLIIAQLMNAIEEEYDIEVPYMDFKRCETIAEAAGYIKRLNEE